MRLVDKNKMEIDKINITQITWVQRYRISLCYPSGRKTGERKGN